MVSDIKERVGTLEFYMKELAYQQLRTDMALHELSEEMKDFKDEMKDFKSEMKAYKEENRQQIRQMNKQWGDLANKMGTLVEDIIAPSVRPVLKKYFGADIDYFAVTIKKNRKDLNLKGEFDIVAVEGDRVFLVEVKSTPKREYLYEFMENIEKFKTLFDEYRHKTLIPIFASLRLEEEIVGFATENGIYAMAYREWDYMDLLNYEAIQARQE